MKTLALAFALMAIPLLADDASDKQPVTVWAAVVEVLPDGLIVQCPNAMFLANIPNPGDYACGRCFLKNYPDKDKVVDGDKLMVKAIPSTPYSYQGADGSIITIHSYTYSGPMPSP